MTPLKLNGPAARVGAACIRAARSPTTRLRSSQIAGPSRRAYGSAGSSSSAAWTTDAKGRVLALSTLTLLSAAAYLSLAQRVELDAAPPARNPSLSDPLRLVSAKEVMAHTTEDDCWVIIHDPVTGQDKVWDVTEFIELHPGGAEVIVNNSGRDATKIFAPVHPKGIIERTLDSSKLMGILDPETRSDLPDDGPSDDELRVQQARRDMPPVEAMFNLEDFEKVAKDVLAKTAWAYYESAGDDEFSKRENAYAYKRYFFRPRTLRPVGTISMESTILGGRIKTALPIYVSPAAMAKLGHPEGELNLVRAASSGGIMQGVSINASCSLEEMAEVRTEADRPWIFQIYLDRNRANSEALVKKVEQMGFAAIMFTVDSAATGNRELDRRSKPVVKQAPGVATLATQGVAQAISGYQDPNLSWDDVTWLKSLTKLPIIVKGLQTVEDVELAAKYGAEAVILSNHGGRSLDFSPPPIDVLYEMRQTKPELFSQVEVWIDGGVRRGTDVVKALCLGAKAVGLGRSFLYANATHGQEGAEKVIQIMNEEIATTMRNMGVSSLDQLGPDYVKYWDREPAPGPRSY